MIFCYLELNFCTNVYYNYIGIQKNSIHDHTIIGCMYCKVIEF